MCEKNLSQKFYKTQILDKINTEYISVCVCVIMIYYWYGH